MTKPISPAEAEGKRRENIPGEVIEAFNEMIIKNLSSGSSKFAQKEVVAVIMGKMNVSEDELIDRKWLDVESLYETQGWKVVYDSPAYNESYAASFEFRTKR